MSARRLRPTARFARGLTLLVAVALLAVSCRSREEYLARGNKYFAAKQYAEAVVEYLNAVQKDPQYGEARFQLGLAYEELHDFPNAAQQYVNAAELMPANVEAQIKGARMYLMGRKFDEARDCAERALRHEPKNVVALILHANAMQGLKRQGTAFTDIQRAIQLDPTRIASYEEYGIFQLSSGASEQAEINLKRAADMATLVAGPHLTLASVYWAQGRMADAEAELNRAITIEPKNVTAHRALATFYLSTDRAAQAEAHLRAIADDNPTPSARLALADYYIVLNRKADAIKILNLVAKEKDGYGDARSRLAAIEYDAGRKQEAHRIIDETLVQDPSSSRALLTKGQFLLVEQKLDEALTSVKAAVAADGRSVQAHYLLAALYAANQDADAAAREFNEVLKLDPNAVAAKMELGKLHLATGQASLAADFATQAVNAKPQSIEAQVLLIRSLIGKGEISSADAVMRPLLHEHDDRADLHALSGTLQMMLGQPVLARQEFERALKMQPDAIDPLNGLTVLDLRESNVGAARARVEQQLAKHPNDSALLLLAARTYRAAGDLGKVEATLRKAIEVDPSNSPAYDMLGNFFASQGKLDQAVKEFEELARRDTKSVPVQIIVGMLLQSQHKTAEAEKRYVRALELNPRAAVAANNLAWLYTEGGGNLDVALQLAQVAKEQLPEQSDVNDTLGWVYYNKGLSQLAIGPMSLAIERDPTNPSYRYHLGLAHMKNGDLDLAREALESALKLSADFEGASDARKILAGLR